MAEEERKIMLPVAAVIAPKLIDLLWHGFKRFSSVILIALLIALPILGVHQYGDRHEKIGYHKGYAQAIKDRPTYGSVGTVINRSEKEKLFKWAGVDIELLFIQLKAGH